MVLTDLKVLKSKDVQYSDKSRDVNPRVGACVNLVDKPSERP